MKSKKKFIVSAILRDTQEGAEWMRWQGECDHETAQMLLLDMAELAKWLRKNGKSEKLTYSYEPKNLI